MEMASYLLLVLRPYYASCLLSEIVRKTTANYEVVVWMNCESRTFEDYVMSLSKRGLPVRIVGRTPENIGMCAFRSMISEAKGDLLIQLDDDVIMISRRAIEEARKVFSSRPEVGLLCACTWQDEYTRGAHARPQDYVLRDPEHLLYDGVIDGGFTFYPQASRPFLMKASFSKYGGLGAETVYHLEQAGKSSHLSRRIKMFHLHGPVYHWYFNHLGAEILKYRSVGFGAMADLYEKHSEFPSRALMRDRLEEIRSHFESFDGSQVKP